MQFHMERQHLMTNVGACSACVVQCSLEIEMRLAESCDVIICSVQLASVHMTVVLPSAEKSLKTLCNNHVVAAHPEDTNNVS